LAASPKGQTECVYADQYGTIFWFRKLESLFLGVSSESGPMGQHCAEAQDSTLQRCLAGEKLATITTFYKVSTTTISRPRAKPA
jgi:hypothetical protein